MLDFNGFWELIEAAGRAHVDRSDRAWWLRERLEELPAAQIAAWEGYLQLAYGQLATRTMWAAATLAEPAGGAGELWCSGREFEDFRGWVISLGREAWLEAWADPDSLARQAAMRSAAAYGHGTDLTWQELPHVAVDSWENVTGSTAGFLVAVERLVGGRPGRYLDGLPEGREMPLPVLEGMFSSAAEVRAVYKSSGDMSDLGPDMS